MTDTDRQPEPVPDAGRRRSDRNPWYLLLVLPVLLLIYPPLYNRSDPELAGIPFFYWYQLAVVPIGVISTAIVYLRTRTPYRGGREDGR